MIFNYLDNSINTCIYYYKIYLKSSLIHCHDLSTGNLRERERCQFETKLGYGMSPCFKTCVQTININHIKNIYLSLYILYDF